MKNISESKQYFIDAIPGAAIGGALAYFIVRKHEHLMVTIISVALGVFVGTYMQHFLLDKGNEQMESQVSKNGKGIVIETTKK